MKARKKLCAAGYQCGSRSYDEYGRDVLDHSSKACPSGQFCPRGSTDQSPLFALVGSVLNNTAHSPYKCPKGYYCSGGNSSDPRNLGDSLRCSAGYYCPESSSSASQIDCPRGYYCEPGSFNALGHTASSDVLDTREKTCAEGHYCPARSVSQEGSGHCDAGYYCSKGSYDLVGRNIYDSSIKYCEKDYYCPSGTKGDDSQSSIKHSSSNSHVEGDGLARKCPDNSQAELGSSTLSQCLGNAGYYGCQEDASNPECERTEPGYYSATRSNVRKNCDPGKYCETAGLGAPTGYCETGITV